MTLCLSLLLSIPGSSGAQPVRLPDGDRTRLLPFAERLVVPVQKLSDEADRTFGRSGRAHSVPRLVTRLEDDTIVLRAALRRNRPIDLAAELETLRDTLVQVQDRLESPDAAPSLDESVRTAFRALDRLETEAAALGYGTGKAAARVELPRQGEADGPARGSAAFAPDELLGLSHDLHVHLMKAEELEPTSRPSVAFTRLGDLAYAFHHEMHDGTPSEADVRDRVDEILRTFAQAERDRNRTGLSAELQNEWREIGRIVDRLRNWRER
jgi:hypothetical protein